MTENTAAPSAAEALLDMTTDANASRQVYDQWASKYEKDVEEWGYDMPETVATLLAKHLLSNNNNNKEKLRILDAGAGDGLSGLALRKAGFGHDKACLVGVDFSTEMLAVAKSRQCYDHVQQLNLNETPFDSSLLESFSSSKDAASSALLDAITCVGVMTYVEPKVKGGTLREFCRHVKPGGYICYTNRTDKLERHAEEELALEAEGLWKLVEKSGALPYLPNHPDFGDKIQVVIHLYQRTTNPLEK